MICPKCGRPVEANAVICTGCDFILDTEFLGEEMNFYRTPYERFGRLSYDVTDNLNVYAQAQWSSNENFSYAYPHDIYYGGLDIPVSNLFVPASVAAQAQALGLETLELGTWFKDLGSTVIDNTRENASAVVGFNTELLAFDTDWNWDGYVQYGAADQVARARNSARFDRLSLALDVVADPDTGAPVCRSSLSNPGNGCIPFNLLSMLKRVIFSTSWNMCSIVKSNLSHAKNGLLPRRLPSLYF